MLASNSINASMAAPRIKFRSACDSCFSAKVRCDGIRTGCRRCREQVRGCHYSESRVGKVIGKRRKRPLPSTDGRCVTSSLDMVPWAPGLPTPTFSDHHEDQKRRQVKATSSSFPSLLTPFDNNTPSPKSYEWIPINNDWSLAPQSPSWQDISNTAMKGSSSAWNDWSSGWEFDTIGAFYNDKHELAPSFACPFAKAHPHAWIWECAVTRWTVGNLRSGLQQHLLDQDSIHSRLSSEIPLGDPRHVDKSIFEALDRWQCEKAIYGPASVDPVGAWHEIYNICRGLRPEAESCADPYWSKNWVREVIHGVDSESHPRELEVVGVGDATLAVGHLAHVALNSIPTRITGDGIDIIKVMQDIQSESKRQIEQLEQRWRFHSTSYDRKIWPIEQQKEPALQEPQQKGRLQPSLTLPSSPKLSKDQTEACLVKTSATNIQSSPDISQKEMKTENFHDDRRENTTYEVSQNRGRAMSEHLQTKIPVSASMTLREGDIQFSKVSGHEQSLLTPNDLTNMKRQNNNIRYNEDMPLQRPLSVLPDISTLYHASDLKSLFPVLGSQILEASKSETVSSVTESGEDSPFEHEDMSTYYQASRHLGIIASPEISKLELDASARVRICVHLLIRAFNLWTHRLTASQATSNYQSKSPATSVTFKGQTESKGKEPRKRDRDDEEENSSERNLKYQKTESSESSSCASRLVGCPFNKYDDVLFGVDSPDSSYRVCSTWSSSGTHHLKQHLLRVHRTPEIYCYICCRKDFTSEQSLKDHLLQRICEICEPPKYREKINNDLVKQLNLIGKNAHGTDIVKYWYQIFDTLFPGARDHQDVSPYYDQGVYSRHINLFLQFSERNVTRIMMLIEERMGASDNLDWNSRRIREQLQSQAVHEAVSQFNTWICHRQMPQLGIRSSHRMEDAVHSSDDQRDTPAGSSSSAQPKFLGLSDTSEDQTWNNIIGLHSEQQLPSLPRLSDSSITDNVEAQNPTKEPDDSWIDPNPNNVTDTYASQTNTILAIPGGMASSGNDSHEDNHKPNCTSQEQSNSIDITFVSSPPPPETNFDSQYFEGLENSNELLFESILEGSNSIPVVKISAGALDFDIETALDDFSFPQSLVHTLPGHYWE